MSKRIEFDDGDLDQFPPAVQEALLRLWRQQQSSPRRDPDALAPARKLVAERVKRGEGAIRYREDGSIIAPDLFRLPKEDA